MMKVLLAGYNLDIETIKGLTKNKEEKIILTPETISAAYARISRSAKSVNELRKMAREEVEKARNSNKNIIFNMGHHSIAEHAVFNFDIMGVSRLAIEEIEKFRLCSYTEKSQRYITLGAEHVLPEEIEKSEFKTIYIDTIKTQHKFYDILFQKLKEYIFQKHADLAKDPKKHNLLEGWAKEDARYISCLASTGQLGQTINARNLELLFRRFASHELSEVRELGRRLFSLVEKVSPSIILFTKANDFDRNTYPALRELTEQILSYYGKKKTENLDLKGPVKLVNHTFDADNITVATLINSSSKLSFDDCLMIARKMGIDEKKEIIKTSTQYMEFYDTPLREYEYVHLTFDLIVSASCFAQLKRHRMASIICQRYDTDLGITIPESITEVGMEKEFKEIIKQTEDVYSKISKKLPASAQYILTNAHRRRVLLRVNARELYHISRLREDKFAQWDIRERTHEMVELAKEVMPLTFLFIGGKDIYPKIYEEIFGKAPKVAQEKIN